MLHSLNWCPWPECENRVKQTCMWDFFSFSSGPAKIFCWHPVLKSPGWRQSIKTLLWSLDIAILWTWSAPMQPERMDGTNTALINAYAAWGTCEVWTKSCRSDVGVAQFKFRCGWSKSRNAALNSPIVCETQDCELFIMDQKMFAVLVCGMITGLAQSYQGAENVVFSKTNEKRWRSWRLEMYLERVPKREIMLTEKTVGLWGSCFATRAVDDLTTRHSVWIEERRFKKICISILSTSSGGAKYGESFFLPTSTETAKFLMTYFETRKSFLGVVMNDKYVYMLIWCSVWEKVILCVLLTENTKCDFSYMIS